MRMCEECKEKNLFPDDYMGTSCEHCDMCGRGGVSKDPRFQRGGWCEVCKRKYELAEEEWYANNDSSNMEDGATPWWNDFKRKVGNQ